MSKTNQADKNYPPGALSGLDFAAFAIGIINQVFWHFTRLFFCLRFGLL
jgi:hypothetical protein